MGFYDTSCMITGLDAGLLEQTVAVLLHDHPTGYRPISLGIRGAYTGYGTLDGVLVDRNTALITEFFSAAHRAGRLHARDETRTTEVRWFDPDIDVESLLYLVERTTTCAREFDVDAKAGGWGYPPSTVLDGQLVVLAMIAEPVWGELTAHPDTDTPLDALMHSAFGADTGVAGEIYGGHLPDVDAELRALSAVVDFVRQRPALRWAPPGEPEQRYYRGLGGQFDDEDREQFMAAARRDYCDAPSVLAALDAYARQNPWPLG